MAKGHAGDVFKALIETAANEARRRGDRRIGTDHLLMAVLQEDDASVSSELGVSREEVATADDSLDREALAAVGFDVRSMELPALVAPPRRLPPLSSGSRKVIKAAVEFARPHKTGRIEPIHFLAALLVRQKPDPAIELLDFLGVDVHATRERVLRKVAKDRL